jgi:hypothetical protein
MNQPESENPPAPAPAPQPTDSRRRLRELLSIPERDRTDDQWDEIIELEIQLAPGNRVSAAEQGGQQGAGGPQQKPAGSGQGKKHRPRGNNNRRQRQNKPPGNAA